MLFLILLCKGSFLYIGLIGDEERSDLNAMLLARVKTKELIVDRLGLLEVNNACHNTKDLIEVIYDKRGL